MDIIDLADYRLDLLFTKQTSILTTLTHYQTTNFIDSSKLKEFADDNFKFDEKGRKLTKRVENTVRKGEIAR